MVGRQLSGIEREGSGGASPSLLTFFYIFIFTCTGSSGLTGWTCNATVAAHWRSPAMPIFQVILVFVVVGLVLWLINSYVPMQDAIKRLMNIAVVVLMVVWLLYLLFPGVWNMRVGPH